MRGIALGKISNYFFHNILADIIKAHILIFCTIFPFAIN